MSGYGERICGDCTGLYIAQSPHQLYCSWQCNRRAARRRRARKPASDNWRPEITRSAPQTAEPHHSEPEAIAVPITPEEAKRREKAEKLRRDFPPISGDEALKTTGYSTEHMKRQLDKKEEDK